MVQQDSNEALARGSEMDGYKDLQRLIGVDCIAGGFPCQDVSIAGKGAGLEGERSGLWWEMLRTVRLVRPRYVLVENVAALRFRGMGEVLGSLAESGYDAEWNSLRAEQFGAPHRRERVFIVANDHAMRKQQSQGRKQDERGRDNDAAQKSGSANRNDRQRDTESEAVRARRVAANRCAETADAGRERLERCFKKAPQRGQFWSLFENARCVEDLRGRPDLPEPLVRRNDDGFRQRIHGLGNAIVPQVAEYVGRCVMETERIRAEKALSGCHVAIDGEQVKTV